MRLFWNHIRKGKDEIRKGKEEEYLVRNGGVLEPHNKREIERVFGYKLGRERAFV